VIDRHAATTGIARAAGVGRDVRRDDVVRDVRGRVAAYARGLGMEIFPSPAVRAAPHGLSYALRALREAFYLHWYHVGVAYSRLIRSRRLLERVT
jgi:hypothetical protein